VIAPNSQPDRQRRVILANVGFALVAVATGLLALSSATAAGVEERNGLIAFARQNAGLQDQIFVMDRTGRASTR
jgi:hypothetical protein